MVDPIFSVRPARLSDAPALAHIHRGAREAAMPWLPRLHTIDKDVQFFRGQIEKDCEVSAACLGVFPVAFIAISPNWIDHLYVAPAFWRCGVGRQLLEAHLSTVSNAQLWTFQDNRAARAFYRSFGFVEVEITDGWGNEEKTPDVRLVWRAG